MKDTMRKNLPNADVFTKKLIAVAVPLLFTLPAHAFATENAQNLEIYVDQNTKQIFSEPGQNRVKMGVFQPVAEQKSSVAGSNNVSAQPSIVKQASAAGSDNAKVKLGPSGVGFESEDGQFKFNIGGRLHADATWHDSDKLQKSGEPIEAHDGTEIRRARIDFRGKLWNDFNFQTEADFADNEVGMKDLFLNYTGWKFGEITVGHQKQSISMELQESSNDIMFTERSLVNSLTGPLFDRAIGLHFKTSDKDWSGQLGFYGDSMKSNRSNSNKGSGKADEGFGATTRWTIAPINTKDDVIHLGGFAGYRSTNGKGELNDNSPSFGYETTHMSNFKLTDTGNISGVHDANMFGLELAAMHGPFSLQGEYVKANIKRDYGLPSLDFDAFYVQAGWTLTGESRTYKGSDGEFKRLKPGTRFQLGKSGWGAWELAFRYDQNDLTDQNIHGGSQKRATLALNWYLNQNVRLMADYSRNFDIVGSPVKALNGGQPGDVDVITLRTQWAY